MNQCLFVDLFNHHIQNRNNCGHSVKPFPVLTCTFATEMGSTILFKCAQIRDSIFIITRSNVFSCSCTFNSMSFCILARSLRDPIRVALFLGRGRLSLKNCQFNGPRARGWQAGGLEDLVVLHKVGIGFKTLAQPSKALSEPSEAFLKGSHHFSFIDGRLLIGFFFSQCKKYRQFQEAEKPCLPPQNSLPPPARQLSTYFLHHVSLRYRLHGRQQERLGSDSKSTQMVRFFLSHSSIVPSRPAIRNKCGYKAVLTSSFLSSNLVV
jgi:hypothetical protein